MSFEMPGSNLADSFYCGGGFAFGKKPCNFVKRKIFGKKLHHMVNNQLLYKLQFHSAFFNILTENSGEEEQET